MLLETLEALCDDEVVIVSVAFEPEFLLEFVCLGLHTLCLDVESVSGVFDEEVTDIFDFSDCLAVMLE